MSATICERNNFQHLEKLIYTEIMLKIFNDIYTSDFLQPELYPIN